MIKKRRLVTFVLLTSVVANAQGDQKVQKNPLAGDWDTVSTLPNGNELESVLKLRGTNDKLSGELDGRNSSKMDKITVKDGSVSLEFELDFNGNTLDCVIDAEIKGVDELVGKWNITRPNGNEVSGDWKASRRPDAGWKFVHLFYFKFKDDVPEEEIAELMKELAGLKGKIPGLKEFVVGKNVAPRTHGFQYGVIAVLDKPEDLEVYEKHPEHAKLVKKIGPKMVHGVTMDFVPLKSNNADGSSTALDLKGKFIHAFCFKFKPDVEEEKVDGLMQELADSKELIPVLRELVVGKNVARDNHGFQYGEIAVFDKPEGEKVFQKHPEHRSLVPKIVPNMQMGITLDFVPIEN